MIKKIILTLVWSFILWLFFWQTFASSWSCSFSWNSNVSYVCLTTVDTPVFYSVSFSWSNVSQSSYITVSNPSFITLSNTTVAINRPFTVYWIDSSGTTWPEWPPWADWLDSVWWSWSDFSVFFWVDSPWWYITWYSIQQWIYNIQNLLLQSQQSTWYTISDIDYNSVDLSNVIPNYIAFLWLLGMVWRIYYEIKKALNS